MVGHFGCISTQGGMWSILLSSTLACVYVLSVGCREDTNESHRMTVDALLDGRIAESTDADIMGDSGLSDALGIDGNIEITEPDAGWDMHRSQDMSLPPQIVDMLFEDGGPALDVAPISDVSRIMDTFVSPSCMEGASTCHSNATCEDQPDGFLCRCNPGFEGDGIDCTNIDNCADSPCLNGGTCSDQTSGYLCTCSEGYDGEQCENPVYSQDELDYFFEVVMNIEFGGSGFSRIHKWINDIYIYVHGDPTPLDLAELDAVVNEINALQTATTLSVVDDETEANLDLYFTTIAEFRSYEPNYINGNDGFFWTYWLGGAIVSANLFVRSGQTEVYRRHLLREELTQSLGLMNDSNRYPESIFYAGWTDTVTFLDIDRRLISMLYRDDILVNMDAESVLEVLAP